MIISVQSFFQLTAGLKTVFSRYRPVHQPGRCIRTRRNSARSPILIPTLINLNNSNLLEKGLQACMSLKPLLDRWKDSYVVCMDGAVFLTQFKKERLVKERRLASFVWAGKISEMEVSTTNWLIYFWYMETIRGYKLLTDKIKDIHHCGPFSIN